MQWLKKHWGSEFRFLASDGLNINKEEDREEGRSILRAILAGSEDSDDSDICRDYPNDDRPEGQLADYFGLKFYKTEDCEEAKSIVSSMMHPDNDDYASD
ncbi:hypothetical protein B0J13DRAFT_682403 [Dactylonectria estremocensis]|uniref:Uncharacterized protein n=1 Tax=Dactylonectria estremocensis TaxID=1079267 RepID=A0A9P9CYU0_9HYPO|nr:hypothetical protein B0J13DRAFT_682403 [Dactylonectria estremocensis]